MALSPSRQAATPAETVHELRKAAKKRRYLIECFGGLYAKSARTTFVARLKSLQDTLGEHQDAEVHAHALRTIADDPRHQWHADHWDRRMRNGESYEEKWTYVRDNPVRHHLVERVEEWPYQGEMNVLGWS